MLRLDDLLKAQTLWQAERGAFQLLCQFAQYDPNFRETSILSAIESGQTNQLRAVLQVSPPYQRREQKKV